MKKNNTFQTACARYVFSGLTFYQDGSLLTTCCVVALISLCSVYKHVITYIYISFHIVYKAIGLLGNILKVAISVHFGSYILHV